MRLQWQSGALRPARGLSWANYPKGAFMGDLNYETRHRLRPHDFAILEDFEFKRVVSFMLDSYPA